MDSADFLSFITIGAQKCGTTSLFEYLSQNPAVTAPVTKELHYFDQHFCKGLKWYRAQWPLPASDSSRQLGEATPMYMFHPHAMRRIRSLAPQCRLIVLLRNPVDRAYSHFQHSVALSHENRVLEEAIFSEEPRLSQERDRMLRDENYFSKYYQRFSYLARGRYFEQLQYVLNFFPKEQLFVICSEELFAGPGPVLRELCGFLDLPYLQGLRLKHYYGRSYLPLADETRSKLQEYFVEHNERLFELIGRRFPW
jgi:hypothetical protein